ncbi:MAG: winged helix-turn-helix transcriptional regulator [Burkholderiales bacterium]|nr:winged helix-turn-helix transcriptional regulator [Burkholderiales bacterium]
MARSNRARASEAPVDTTLIDQFVLTDVVSHLIRRAHFRAEELFTSEFGKDGLTPRQKALLIIVYQNPGANQNELSERIALDRNSFAEMLNRMITAGYVERRRAKDDARAYEITITPKGIDVLLEILPRDAEVEARVMAPLPEEYRALFIKCLKIMVGLTPP